MEGWHREVGQPVRSVTWEDTSRVAVVVEPRSGWFGEVVRKAQVQESIQVRGGRRSGRQEKPHRTVQVAVRWKD